MSRLGMKCLGVVPSLCATALGQTTTRVNVAWNGAEADNYTLESFISGNGRWVVFSSYADNLVPDFTPWGNVFVRDRQAGVTEWLSRALDGGPANDSSEWTTISADGRYVAFHSWATNLVAGDDNGQRDVFVRDRLGATTELISVTPTGTSASGGFPFISADGRYVAFASASGDLVPGDTNFLSDIFVRDRQSGTTEIVSVSSSGVQADSYCLTSVISADGRFVTFESAANTLVIGDTNVRPDIFLRDRQAGTTELISVGLMGIPADGDVFGLAPLSADGRFVAFSSTATNLVNGDTNGDIDGFVRDRQAGTTERVTVDSNGSQVTRGGSSWLSADARYVLIATPDALVPEDTNNAGDGYLRDRTTGALEPVSVSSTGTWGNSWGGGGTMSFDNRSIAIISNASNLVPGDTNGKEDAFVRDRGPALAAFCPGDGRGVPCPCGNSGATMHGCENSSTTGGAVLSASGARSLTADTLVLTTSGERPTVLSIVLQGSAAVAPVTYGDGLRCVGGSLKRLYAKVAVAGVVTVPQGTDPSISSRSAALGDVIPPGASRYYQTYYRDSNPSFCQSPLGNTWNISSAIEAIWDY